MATFVHESEHGVHPEPDEPQPQCQLGFANCLRDLALRGLPSHMVSKVYRLVAHAILPYTEQGYTEAPSAAAQEWVDRTVRMVCETRTRETNRIKYEQPTMPGTGALERPPSTTNDHYDNEPTADTEVAFLMERNRRPGRSRSRSRRPTPAWRVPAAAVAHSHLRPRCHHGEESGPMRENVKVRHGGYRKPPRPRQLPGQHGALTRHGVNRPDQSRHA